MPLPQLKGPRTGATIRTRNRVCCVSVRTRLCQILPAADSTSTMPYRAEPAVSGTATIRTSTGPAAARGIHIEALESELEGDIDLRGFLGLDESVPKGYTDIRINFRVRTDSANLEQLKRLSAFSPVLNTITQGANVTINLEAQ